MDLAEGHWSATHKIMTSAERGRYIDKLDTDRLWDLDDANVLPSPLLSSSLLLFCQRK